MKLFKNINDKSKCWWCDSGELSREHKFKKTDLEILYGKSYSELNRISRIRFRSESKGKYLQSSDSEVVKFPPNLCKKCNNEKSQKFDLAYEKFINYYYMQKLDVLETGVIELKKIFGDDWEQEILNVERYIAKHVGCRVAENGYKPHSNLIEFLNGKQSNRDLKIVFQCKPYQFGSNINPIENIFLGPIIPINVTQNKSAGIVSSFSGWYTFVNLSWNYVFEENINMGRKYNDALKLDIIKYEDPEVLNIQLRMETLEKDWGLGLEQIEYYPFFGKYRDLDHYKYMKEY